MLYVGEEIPDSPVTDESHMAEKNVERLFHDVVSSREIKHQTIILHSIPLGSLMNNLKYFQLVQKMQQYKIWRDEVAGNSF